jgi:thioredoxin 1
MITVKKFHATWCGPCKQLAPMLDYLSTQYPGVDFISIDIDENNEQVAGYGIKSVPTVIIEKNGVEIFRFVGIKPIHIYANAIAQNS